MGHWFHSTVVDPGRLPLFFLFVSFIVTFLFIRLSVRMIRAEVSWWPGNIETSGTHLHHMVFGLVTMTISGVCLITLANYDTPIANCVMAVGFGIGSALVLDEFALVLYLKDVYWEEEGRLSVDVVFVAVVIAMLFLLGLRPLGFNGDFAAFQQDHSVLTLIVSIVALVLMFGLGVITLLKGKLWTALIGLFVTPLLIVGAIRLSRPDAPWARRRYNGKTRKRVRARIRERRYRQPVTRWKITVQELLAGRFGPE